MERRPLAAVAVCFAALGALAGGCAVNPVTGRSELSIVSVSEEEEINLGAKAFIPAVQQQGGFYRDPALEDYVQGVGTRLARVSHRPDLDFRYRVLNSSVPNAFALPGGFIVINRGLLTGLKNEAQMAAVLAHETGHVTAKHSLAGYQRALAANLLLAGVSAVAGGREWVMELSGVTASLVQNGFSREQEREADWLGIDYMAKAGYKPQGAVQLQEYFYEQLEGKKNPLFFEGLFRTHPFSGERLDNARARVAKLYPDTADDPRYVLNEPVYLRNTARLREVQKAYDLSDAGDKLLAEKKYGEALARYQAAIAREPDQAPFHASVGRIHLVQKNYPLAETALSRALALDDELFEPHFLMGALRFRKADHRGAIPELSRSMDLLPTKEAAAMLSKSYEATGDLENAKRYAEMAQ